MRKLTNAIKGVKPAAGEIISHQGDKAKARPLLEESYQTFLTLYGSFNPRTLEAQARRDRWSQ